MDILSALIENGDIRTIEDAENKQKEEEPSFDGMDIFQRLGYLLENKNIYPDINISDELVEKVFKGKYAHFITTEDLLEISKMDFESIARYFIKSSRLNNTYSNLPSSLLRHGIRVTQSYF